MRRKRRRRIVCKEQRRNILRQVKVLFNWENGNSEEEKGHVEGEKKSDDKNKVKNWEVKNRRVKKIRSEVHVGKK